MHNKKWISNLIFQVCCPKFCIMCIKSVSLYKISYHIPSWKQSSFNRVDRVFRKPVSVKPWALSSVKGSVEVHKLESGKTETDWVNFAAFAILPVQLYWKRSIFFISHSCTQTHKHTHTHYRSLHKATKLSLCFHKSFLILLGGGVSKNTAHRVLQFPKVTLLLRIVISLSADTCAGCQYQ